ncbi:hypothetical protein GCM10009785_07800 [Brooklawnia cerclae]
MNRLKNSSETGPNGHSHVRTERVESRDAAESILRYVELQHTEPADAEHFHTDAGNQKGASHWQSTWDGPEAQRGQRNGGGTDKSGD